MSASACTPTWQLFVPLLRTGTPCTLGRSSGRGRTCRSASRIPIATSGHSRWKLVRDMKDLGRGEGAVHPSAEDAATARRLADEVAQVLGNPELADASAIVSWADHNVDAGSRLH